MIKQTLCREEEAVLEGDQAGGKGGAQTLLDQSRRSWADIGPKELGWGWGFLWFLFLSYCKSQRSSSGLLVSGKSQHGNLSQKRH